MQFGASFYFEKLDFWGTTQGHSNEGKQGKKDFSTHH